MIQLQAKHLVLCKKKLSTDYRTSFWKFDTLFEISVFAFRIFTCLTQISSSVFIFWVFFPLLTTPHSAYYIHFSFLIILSDHVKEQTAYLLIPDIINTMFWDKYDLLSLTKRYEKHHIIQFIMLVLNLSLYFLWLQFFFFKFRNALCNHWFP